MRVVCLSLQPFEEISIARVVPRSPFPANFRLADKRLLKGTPIPDLVKCSGSLPSCSLRPRPSRLPDCADDLAGSEGTPLMSLMPVQFREKSVDVGIAAILL